VYSVDFLPVNRSDTGSFFFAKIPLAMPHFSGFLGKCGSSPGTDNYRNLFLTMTSGMISRLRTRRKKEWQD
jgi:hypothetical protein